MKIFFKKIKKCRTFAPMKNEPRVFADHIAALYDLRAFLKSENGSVPKEVSNAVGRAEGRVTNQGHKKGISPTGVWRLLSKYAPDRYGHTEVFFLK